MYVCMYIYLFYAYAYTTVEFNSSNNKRNKNMHTCYKPCYALNKHFRPFILRVNFISICADLFDRALPYFVGQLFSSCNMHV